MAEPEVGLLHPGEMGASVGAALVAGGARVHWCARGRSDASARRAASAGLVDAGTLDALVRRVEIIFSVCPPASATEVAEAVFADGFRGLFVDANAIAPATAESIAARAAAAGATFVDGGIVGPPAVAPGSTRLYLSGEAADSIAARFSGTALEARVVPGPPGAASALKMAYAGWTKGLSALLLAVRGFARESGVEASLLGEWQVSQPHLAAQSEHTARGVAPKASGPVLERSADLAGLLANIEPGDVLFIDEIHRLPAVVEEILYPAMEDFRLDVMIGQGPTAQSVRIDLPRFTLVGATTRAGLLTAPLRDRFGWSARLDYYAPAELVGVLKRSARLLEIGLDDAAAGEIAGRSRGTPRIANRLLRRVRDFAEVESGRGATIGAELAGFALGRLDVDAAGFDALDRALLLALLDKFDGGPAGIETLAAAIGEDRGTLEDLVEPFLIQCGFLERTPRGRLATPRAWEHFGRTRPPEGGAQGRLL